MKIYDIWVEGYACTGQSAGAQLLASVKSDTFDNAVLSYKKTLSTESQKLIDKQGGLWRFWGCRIYDNEHKARKSFG